jgi:hypothetical protein
VSTTIKADPADAGCWIDGHWGQYGPACLVDIAVTHGWTDPTDDVAKRHLAEAGHVETLDPITPDEFEALMDASNDAEAWLNDNVAPEGFAFGWHDGEFFLWDTDTWEAEA